MTDAEKIKMLREALETCRFDYDDEEEGYYWFDEELVEKALAATVPTQSEPEIDERAEFQKVMTQRDPFCSFIRNGDGTYASGSLESIWSGWQARAALRSE